MMDIVAYSDPSAGFRRKALVRAEERLHEKRDSSTGKEWQRQPV